MRTRPSWAILGLVLLLAGCGMSSDDMGDGYERPADDNRGNPGHDGNHGGGAGGQGEYSHGAPRSEDWQKGEEYTHYGENEFLDPTEEPLCTFGVDVDTASYTLMRRDIMGGLLPNPDGVRVEEYLNFFSYDDAPPADDAPDAFAVHLEGAPSPFGENLHLLRVGIKGKELPPVERGNANLVFLVDVSGSMASDDKLPMVQDSLRLLVDQLRVDDTIAIVTYAGNVGVALHPTPAGAREKILAAIDALSPWGSTNGEGGIVKAYDLAEANFVENGINRVILCTDGDFNVGKTGQDLVDLIVSYRERGIYLTTLGFGRGNYNDSTMKQLASKGNGNYAYVDSLQEADRVVRRNLLGTLLVIAKDVKLQLSFDPETVVRYRLLGYENRRIEHENFEDPTEDTGDIGSGHHVTALLELELKEGVTMGEVAKVATLDLRYKFPGDTFDTPLHRPITTEMFASSLDEASSDLRFAAAVAEYAEILRRSKHSEGVRFDEVFSLAAPVVNGDPDRAGFLELVSLAREVWKSRIGGID